MLDYSNIALSQVVKKYDQFTNKTTISLTGKRALGKPIFYIWSQSGGERLQEGFDSLEVVFLVKAICPPLNFVAGGKRIQPDGSSSNQPTPTFKTLVTSGKSEDYTFTFNFYNLSQLKQIA